MSVSSRRTGELDSLAPPNNALLISPFCAQMARIPKMDWISALKCYFGG